MAEKKPFGPKTQKGEMHLVLGRSETKDEGAADRKKMDGMAKRNRRENKKKNMMVDGDMAKPRYDRPGRRLGGRVGADVAPLSTAARPVIAD